MRRLIETVVGRPIWFALGLVALTGLAIFAMLSGFEVESDISNAIKGDSQAYKDFAAFETRFGAPSKDEVFMVQTADLGADGVLDALENMVVELTLTEGVLGVMSLFSLPDPEGRGFSFLTRSDIADLPAAERLDLAFERLPLASQLLSEDRTTTLVSVIPDRALAPGERQRLLAEALALADPQLTITPIGLTAVQRTIATGLIDDLLFLTPAIILICLGVSLVLFRSWRSAVICTVPAVLALVWTLGTMASFGIAFTAVLAIAPAVLIVLGIADAIHVFNAIARKTRSAPLATAIVDGIIDTLPAIVLATATTVLAFASLRIVGSPTLSDLALVGSIGLFLALCSVVLTVPVASQLLLSNRSEIRPLVSFGAVSRLAERLLGHRRIIALVTMIVLAALATAQTRTVVGFNLTDHVPHRSGVRTALEELDRKLPGSDQFYVVVEDVDRTPEDTEADRARLRAASAALYGDPNAIPDTSRDMPLDNASVQRFRGTDFTAYALPVPARLSDTAADTRSRAKAIEADLAAAGLADVSTVTSFTLMSSGEIPTLVRELRAAFYMAVGAVTVLAMVLLRSVPLALISVAPNLIPILGIEAALVVWGRPLTLIAAIGLTIAFGIAVDNTIHILNRLRLVSKDLRHPSHAEIVEAVTTTAPPIVTSTLILVAGLGTTAISTLPSVTLFGLLVSGALVLAMCAALFLVPSLLAWRETRKEIP